MATWQAYLETQAGRFQDELLALLRIPSISALPEHSSDVQQAAQWVADRLTAAGLQKVQILPTDGHPVVYADWLHAPGKPTILIYGHFDTQPVDPLDLWSSPPFAPEVRDGRVYARGASDDKGNMLIPIQAVEALLKDGDLPLNVKFFLEGQEEIGSPQLPEFVKAHGDLLACDLVVSADSGQWAEDQPALPVGSKGLCGLQIDVRGARTDLHSGSYGGAVPNPIHALVHILDSMRRPDGKIAVTGFFDGVTPLTDGDRALIAAVPFDEADYREQVGVTALTAEPGYTAREQLWARPTLEVNGIWGGFQGEGTKTVLPREAHAKITCRLVPNQDPATILDRVAEHVQQHTPPGVQVTVQKFGATARPYLMPVDHWGNRAAAEVLKGMYGREPYYTRGGGTVPVYELFLTNLGAYSVGFGFGLGDEQIHAPDEFFRLSSFERGHAAWCQLLQRLGEPSA